MTLDHQQSRRVCMLTLRLQMTAVHHDGVAAILHTCTLLVAALKALPVPKNACKYASYSVAQTFEGVCYA